VLPGNSGRDPRPASEGVLAVPSYRLQLWYQANG
jgi:hypothetical protein